MQKRLYYLSLKIIIILTFVLFKAQKLVAQSKIDSSRIRALYFESGGVHYYFRDEISSGLIYSGVGGGHLGIGCHLSNNKKIHHDINLFFQYGTAKYRKIPNEDYANIYRLSGLYSIYWKKPIIDNKVNWSVGVTTNSDAIYIVYPFLFGNNGDTYSIDLISVGPNFGTDYLFKRSRVSIICNIDMIGWNARPQSFNGISPEKTFNESRITGITNNLRLNLKTAYSFFMPKGNSLELSYQWYYRKNTSSNNVLNYAQHNINLRLYFAKKHGI